MITEAMISIISAIQEFGNFLSLDAENQYPSPSPGTQKGVIQ